MKNPFSVQALPSADPSNDRGQRTWMWSPKSDQHISVFSRRKGEEFGGHFHKGEDSAKNPEFFLILSGRIWIKFTDLFGGVFEITLDASEGPVELVIYPWILHEMTALEDCVFIECRGASKFNPEKSDSYPASEFVRKSS